MIVEDIISIKMKEGADMKNTTYNIKFDAVFGAMAGDIIGSVYEWDNIKTKEFELWKPECRFTDDTVMTIAVMSAFDRLMQSDRSANLHELMVREVKRIGCLYPNCGYGRRFIKWLKSEDDKPYNSYGNGSAMRVSSAGAFAVNMEEAAHFAKVSAEITHNHPEGIKGAQAVAVGIFLARTGSTKEEVKTELSSFYDLDFTLDEIRSTYRFDVSCQGSVPQAIVAFLEGNDFEDCIRNAISIGGDSDTIAAMAGSMAAAYYGITEDVRGNVTSYLDDILGEIVAEIASV